MNEGKIIGLLGLAQSAGCIAAGAMATERALMSGRCRLLLVALDTAPETQKRLDIMTRQTNTPVFRVLTKQQLGTAIGKSPKAALAVTDNGFAGSLRRMVSPERV